MKEKTLFSILGTSMGVIGTSLQTEEILRIVSLIITIIGGIITWIVIPILNWYNKSKADGKITTDEMIEGANIIKDGVEKIEQETKKGKIKIFRNDINSLIALLTKMKYDEKTRSFTIIFNKEEFEYIGCAYDNDDASIPVLQRFKLIPRDDEYGR